MYYLKCNRCGHLNEVKSEYLVFCSNCNKKLDNNFSDWQRRNPEKSFDDFKHLVCASENTLVNTANVPKKRHGKLVFWIILPIALVVFYAVVYTVGKFGREAIFRYFISEKTNKEVLTKNWIKETYGDYGLTVETPVKMVKGELSLPGNLGQIIDHMYTYNYMSEKGFKIMINSVKYRPTVKSFTLQGAANGAVNEVKMLKGVTDFNYTESRISKGEIPGIIQKGTFKQATIGIEFINAIFFRGSILWQVSVFFQTNDEVGRIAAKRVIESIEINPPANHSVQQ